MNATSRQNTSKPAEQGGIQVARPRLDPSALTVADLAVLLSRAGGVAIDPEWIAADIDAGAPTNADGTINLVHYTAWLVAPSTPQEEGTATGGD